MVDIDAVLRQLGVSVLERGWLSSNNIVFRRRRGGPVTVVDTGYDTHAQQTLDLLERVSEGAGVDQIFNTHLHSDHCGGNAAIQERWSARAGVPEVSLDAVRGWDASRLTYELTGQTCRRFRADTGIAAGETVQLGDERWEALRAPGHDPESLMFFHRQSRVLISADALWESRLAIIFPELDGRSGFIDAVSVLDCIEALQPTIVLPGHGRPFSNVASALNYSRERLEQFRRDPRRHARSAARALAMFRLLELRAVPVAELETWLAAAPVFSQVMRSGAAVDLEPQALIQSMVRDGLFRIDAQGQVILAPTKE